jgi:hypothetical protein
MVHTSEKTNGPDYKEAATHAALSLVNDWALNWAKKEVLRDIGEWIGTNRFARSNILKILTGAACSARYCKFSA